MKPVGLQLLLELGLRGGTRAKGSDGYVIFWLPSFHQLKTSTKLPVASRSYNGFFSRNSQYRKSEVYIISSIPQNRLFLSPSAT